VITLFLVAGCNQAGRKGSTSGGTSGGQHPVCTSTCDGDRIVACDANGQPSGTLINDCGPDLTCGADPAAGTAACVTPCDPKALAHGYTGCVFYAVDLPQFALPEPVGTIA